MVHNVVSIAYEHCLCVEVFIENLAALSKSMVNYVVGIACDHYFSAKLIL